MSYGLCLEQLEVELGSHKKYNTQPLGDIMKSLEARQNNFKRRAREYSRPSIPNIEQLVRTRSENELPAVHKAKEPNT